MKKDYFNKKVVEIINNINNYKSGPINICISGSNTVKINEVCNTISNKITKILTIDKKVCHISELADKLLSGEGCDFENTLYILYGIEDYFIETSSEMELAYTCLFKMLGMYDNKYIIIIGTNETINDFIDISNPIKYLFGRNVIKVKDQTFNDLYNIYRNALNKNLREKLINNKEFEKKILNYYVKNKTFSPFTNNDFMKFLANYANEKNDLILPFNNYREIKEELKKVVGLDKIKEQLVKLEKDILFMEKSKVLGVNISDLHLNMVLTGNVGMGKTTIAEIITKMFNQLGIINQNKLIKVGREDLVTEDMGQTATITQEIIDNAIGGVLYIEDAYLIGIDENDICGLKCMDILIKNMEERKNEFIVLFSGNKNAMDDYMAFNLSINPLIGYTLDFEKYANEELLNILKLKIQKKKLTISDECDEKLLEIISHFNKMKYFENGYFLDMLLQQILLKHIQNKDNIKQISIKDIPELDKMIKVVPDIALVDPEKVPEEIIHRVAYHELGHAIVRKVLTDEHNISKITIKADADGDLGSVYHKISESSKLLPTEDEIYNDLAVYFAGMVAEKIFLKCHSGGCCSDYQVIKDIVNNMVDRFCMRDFSLSNEENINEIMKKAREMAEKVILEHKEIIEYIKVYLVMKQTITGKEMDKLIECFENNISIEDAINILEESIS